MASGGLTCAKFITFFCNFIFGLTGLAIFSMATIVQFKFRHFSDFLGNTVWTVPVVLMIVGATITIICFLGCCGAIKESSCMILSFVILGALIFLTEIGLGIVGFVQAGSLMKILDQELNYTISEYNNRNDFSVSWNLAQTEFNCCGKQSYKDWEIIFNNGSLPESCCRDLNLNESHFCIPSYANPEGCLDKLWKFLDEKYILLASLSLGIAAIQLLTILFACCLFRRRYERV